LQSVKMYLLLRKNGTLLLKLSLAVTSSQIAEVQLG